MCQHYKLFAERTTILTQIEAKCSGFTQKLRQYYYKTNIRLDWNGLKGTLTNTLAYYDTELITAVRSLIAQVLVGRVWRFSFDIQEIYFSTKMKFE
jgi:hypothetical protein